MATTPRRGLAIGILLFASFMDLLDVTIVQVALPSIGADLGASEAQLEWIVSGYMLAFAVALITGGRLGDLYGRRRVFLIGIAGFTLASAAAAAAWSGEALVATRIAQGLFAALMVPQLLASVQALPDAFAGAGAGGPDDPYADILAGMLRLHEEFTVDELEVVARYLDAVKDVR